MSGWTELCAESSLAAATDDALAARVADLAAAGSVLVGVPAADRSAARRALPEDVALVTLTDASSLDEAAQHVFAVDGRCVVLARRGLTGWDARITAGAWAPAPALLVSAPPPASPRVRGPPQPARGVWIGGGGTLGFPSLVAAFGSVRVGPVVGEVALGAFFPLLIDAYARAGPMVALGRPSPDEPALAVGVLAGAMTWGTVVSGMSGTTVVAALDRYRRYRSRERTASLIRVTAGIDIWTSAYDFSRGSRPSFGLGPRLQLGAGAVVLP